MRSRSPWFGISVLLGILLVFSFLSTALTLISVLGGPRTVVIEERDDGPALAAGTSPSEGNADAPVTIIEFSDFECPFCGRFWKESYGQLKKEYVESGKVRFVYKQFPLSIHAHAQRASEASLCAHAQGKFFAYHDELFANQGALTDPDLKRYARNAGLDGPKFDACLDAGTYREQVLAEQREGAAAGVSGTPTLFVNGKSIVGAQPYAAFKQAIDQALAD